MNDLTKDGGKNGVPAIDADSVILLIQRLVESHSKHASRSVNDVSLDEYTRRLSKTAWATLLGFGKVNFTASCCKIGACAEP